MVDLVVSLSNHERAAVARAVSALRQAQGGEVVRNKLITATMKHTHEGSWRVPMPRYTIAEYEGAVVYIVRCADGSYYTGRSAVSAEKRVSEHNLGIFDGYTKSRRPVKLVFSERFDRIADAIAFERQIKGWSRAKKEALIRRDWDALRELARCRTSKTRKE